MSEKKWNFWLGWKGFQACRENARKDALNEGLRFGFQMCELSCCLSLRWSLSVSLRALSLLIFHAALDLFRITSVLTDHSPDPQKHDKEGKPHHFSHTKQWTKEGFFLYLNYTSNLNLLLKQTLKCWPWSFSHCFKLMWAWFSPYDFSNLPWSEVLTFVSDDIEMYLKNIKENVFSIEYES